MKKTTPAANKTQNIKAKITNASLHTWNKWLAVIHAVQGVAILLLSTSKSFPLTTSYLDVDQLASEAGGSTVLAEATRHLADINIAYLIAAFFFIAAIAHASAAWWCRKFYEYDLKKGMNRIRWFEYSASASLMLVTIAMLTGIGDLSALLMIFALGAIMNLLSLAMEVYNQGKAKPNWLAFNIAGLAGIVPWIALAIYLVGANMYGSGGVPTFVYWIYGSLFVLFAAFAVVLRLQFQKKGKWGNYLYSERGYMILSLAAKTALAWQVFFGTLSP